MASIRIPGIAREKLDTHPLQRTRMKRGGKDQDRDPQEKVIVDITEMTDIQIIET
jgi:hypothetical protein